MQKFTVRAAFLCLIMAAATFGTDRGVSPTPSEATGLDPVKLAAGNLHTCALGPDIIVRCWGLNTSGQLGGGTMGPGGATPVEALGTFGSTQVAVGTEHSCARLAYGEVLCWGKNGSSQLGNGLTVDNATPQYVCESGSEDISAISAVAAPAPCPHLTGVTQIAAGAAHTCAAMVDGSMRCWGANGSGQLGNGTTTPSALPAPVSLGGSKVLRIAVGAFTTCAVLTGGSASCWGENGFGQIGDGTTVDKTVPNPTGAGDVMSISPGNSHTCMSNWAGSVYCWGYNASGSLGDGGACGGTCLLPVYVPGLSDVISVTAGDLQSCAVLATGPLKCWGFQPFGEVGDGTQFTRTTPVTVSGGHEFTAATAGSDHTCATRSDGVPMCWGRNDSGQLGAPSAETCFALACRTTPEPVDGQSHNGAVAISVGYQHSCTLIADGTMRCWGRNDFGQLGNGTMIPSTAPIPVCATGSGPSCSGGDLLRNVAAIGVGRYHSCAIQTSGLLKCWGLNDKGQVGDGTTTNRSLPVTVLASARSVSGGISHTCAAHASGYGYCWGENTVGQLGDGTTTNQTVPTLVCLTGSVGTCTLLDIRTITAGAGFSCASSAVAFLRCWGANSFGALGNGNLAPAINPVTVCESGSGPACPALTVPVVGFEAAEYGHTCAALATGEPHCWGFNGDGQLGDGTTTDTSLHTPVSGISDAVAVTVGYGHSCALLYNGLVMCWGVDDVGQLGNGGGFVDSLTPVQVTLLPATIAISAGLQHTCAIIVNGIVRCWGRNDHGQLGNGTTTNSDTPVTASVDSDLDGCSDSKEIGPDHGLGGVRNPYYFWDFYDVNGTKSVGLADALLILAHFGHASTGIDGAGANMADHNLLDRYIPDPMVGWLTEEANNGVGLADALANLRSFGDSCSAP